MRSPGPAQRIAKAIERRAIAVVVAIVVGRVGAAQQGGVEDHRVALGTLKEKLLRLVGDFRIRMLPRIELVQNVIANAEPGFVDDRSGTAWT